MKLSKDYKYNILCEDKLTHCFIRRFLISQGFNTRRINALPLPAAGCGERPSFSSALSSLQFAYQEYTHLVKLIS